ncbi:MAG: 3-hydroxyacyl-CoA dehydrogenase NAD-binding domain-containing protein [Anaerolineales bacterium]|nr:3-hydroxyacyl-CoA dehydrogenase NAD-binding domain-containing protein [Anaerolineales bacterium]
MTIERVFVAGAGLMGHGIGQVHAAIGKQVTLYEPELARAVAGRDRIAGNLERAVAKGKLTAEEREATLGRVATTDSLDAVRDADLVVEAVFEDVAVKQGLWHQLDERAPAATLFAPNTSSISIDLPASAVSPERRGRFVGMHFFSPVPVMPLVELIRGPTRPTRPRRPSDPGRGAGQEAHRVRRPTGLHRQPDSHAAARRGDADAGGGGPARPMTSTPAPRWASTTRWVRSSSPTSSASTSASTS